MSDLMKEEGFALKLPPKYHTIECEWDGGSMPPGTEKFMFILDLQGVSYRNMDPVAMRTNLDFLQVHSFQ
jgi:hypothetical protein